MWRRGWTLPVDISIRRRPIDFVEVKELYDAAFEAKAQVRVNLRQFRTLLAKAEKLDAAYRGQLARSSACTLAGKAA
jgi:hypothetical protein